MEPPLNYGRLLAARLRPQSGPEAQLLILMYHSIGSNEFIRPSLEVSQRNFERQVLYLKRHYRVISLESAIEAIRNQTVPRNAVVITFDDGYRNNFDIAFPVLKKHDCAATIFVTTDALEGEKSLWSDKLYFWFKSTERTRFRAATLESKTVSIATEQERQKARHELESILMRRKPAARKKILDEVGGELGFAPDVEITDKVPMLTWEQVKMMAGHGIGIGSHTMSHPVLTTLDPASLRSELMESKRLIEQRVERPVRLFAYPFGKTAHFNSHVEAVLEDAGYAGACTAIAGANTALTSPFQLLRVYVENDSGPLFGLKLLMAMEARDQ